MLILFYLFLLLLPTQLGRHFFFDFSSIQGLRNDYLTPTIYLTDLIILSADLMWFFSFLKKKTKLPFRVTGKIKLGAVILLLLFINTIIAGNRWIAAYESLKILEYILFGMVIQTLRPNLTTVIKVLSVDVLYTSLIGFLQFYFKKSIGGLFWLSGERTFYISTPGIANITVAGERFLRPYSIFPHPNVFGGFLAVVLPLILFILFQEKQHHLKKLFFSLTFITGLTALLLTASRASWLVAFAGLFIVFLEHRKINLASLFEKKRITMVLFYFLISTSIFVPLFFPKNIINQNQSLYERKSLLKATMGTFQERPFFGQGLGNSTAQTYKRVAPASGVYAFQPVHNIYLLILSDAGIVGFLFFITLLMSAVFISAKNRITGMALISICLLGFFDHYLVTLQQGQLILLLFLSLAYL